MDSTIENLENLFNHNNSITDEEMENFEDYDNNIENFTNENDEYYSDSDLDSDDDNSDYDPNEDDNQNPNNIENFDNEDQNNVENFRNRKNGYWHLVCRQTLNKARNKGYWSRYYNSKNYYKYGWKPNKPRSKQYLMNPYDLDNDPTYKSNNGKYKFLMRQRGPKSRNMIWEQNTNPFTFRSQRTGNVPGYRGISIPYNQPNSNMYWGGLRYNGSQCLVSGSSNGWWFYALGSFQRWGRGIPNMYRNGNQAAKKVALYVWKNGPKPDKYCNKGNPSNIGKYGVKKKAMILDWRKKSKQYSNLGSYNRTNSLLKSLPLPFYIMRYAPNGTNGYKKIIYKRYTPLNGLPLSQVLTTNWFSTGRINSNVFNKDFSLFSNMNDAKNNKNRWRFCNFNDSGVGFPRDCGKNRLVGGQWVSTYRRNSKFYPWYFYIMDWGKVQCLPPKPKVYSFGDFRIKKMSVQCDDRADIYINGKLVKRISGWNRNFVINNPASKRSGNAIAIDCTNTGGPGMFIATIELYNKSVIISDDTWFSAQNPGAGYWTTPSFPINSNWNNASVNGQQNISGRYKGHVKNQNYYAKQIWSSSNINVRKCYLRKIVGKDPISAKCRINLNNAQARCYLDRYPDLRRAFGNNLQKAKEHWKRYGCTMKENRTYKCVTPPQNVGNFEYNECYGDTWNRALPNYLGQVTNPNECAKKAEQRNLSLFGLQYYGQCFGGNDETRAKMYGKRNNCGKLGTAWTNQLFKRTFPYPPPVPQLNKNNFETFENMNKNLNNYLNNNNQKYTFSVLIIIGILIILYLYCKK